MSRDDFTFEQKSAIIVNNFSKYELLNSYYGIIKCPSCWCKMALGHELKKNGEPYIGTQNYLEIHKKMGFRPIPSLYNTIQRIEIDHLDPCFIGGQADIDNGIMICENCNKVFREFLSRDDKILLLNSNGELMDIDFIEYESQNSKLKITHNESVIFEGKDIISSILHRRMQNKLELEVDLMNFYKPKLTTCDFLT